MHSILALGLFAAATVAQTQTQNDYPYTINPETVSDANRQYWCDQNTAQCPLICLQQPGVNSMSTTSNECDPDALTYSCVCENGVSPNITQYSQTLPFFICQEWGNQCVNACSSNTCADKCRADHPCGAQSPYKGNATASASGSGTATPSASSTSKIPVTGFGGQTSTPNAAAGTFGGSSYAVSMAAVVGSIAIGFSVLL
jgi:hypothetical protein